MDEFLRFMHLTPPPPPSVPDLTRLPTPRQLRFVPGGRAAWTESMRELQHEVETFGKTLSDLTWLDGLKTGGPYFLIAGLIAGLALGWLARGWFEAYMTRRAGQAAAVAATATQGG